MAVGVDAISSAGWSGAEITTWIEARYFGRALGAHTPIYGVLGSPNDIMVFQNNHNGKRLTSPGYFGTDLAGACAGKSTAIFRASVTV